MYSLTFGLKLTKEGMYFSGVRDYTENEENFQSVRDCGFYTFDIDIVLKLQQISVIFILSNATIVSNYCFWQTTASVVTLLNT